MKAKLKCLRCNLGFLKFENSREIVKGNKKIRINTYRCDLCNRISLKEVPLWGGKS